MNKKIIKELKSTKNYDPEIRNHYDAVAKLYGDSPASTMADIKIRKTETDFIISQINSFLKKNKIIKINRLSAIDIGCGNGFTLSELKNKFYDISFSGIENNDSLRKIANARLKLHKIKVMKGDIRNLSSLPRNQYDILICQRVLINLLEKKHQAQALKNLIGLMKKNGVMIFIEAFKSNLNNLNDARKEFGLEVLPPAHHNLYLEDNFFKNSLIKLYDNSSENKLSTHYFLSRVIHPVFLKSGGLELKRNSHFVSFFSQALPDSIGNYSILKMLAFLKK